MQKLRAASEARIALTRAKVATSLGLASGCALTAGHLLQVAGTVIRGAVSCLTTSRSTPSFLFGVFFLSSVQGLSVLQGRNLRQLQAEESHRRNTKIRQPSSLASLLFWGNGFSVSFFNRDDHL